MKPKFNRFVCAVALSVTALSSSVFAAATWNGSVDGSWATLGNWTSVIPTATDLVTYGAGTSTGIAVANGTQNLDGSYSVLGFSVGNNTASPIIINKGTGTNTLTIHGSGILLNSGSGGSFTANVDLALGANQTWTTGNTRNITANNVNLGSFTLNTNVAGTGAITINGVISGSGGVTRAGAGSALFTLTGANDYTGATSVSAGVLNIQNNTATGTTAGGVSVTGGAALQIQNNITVGAEALTLNGAGISSTGALRNISGTNVWQGTVTLGSAARINSDAGTLTFNTASNSITGTNTDLTLGGAGIGTVGGTITTGTGALTKDGAGTWTLSGSNTYSGLTNVTLGTLVLGNATNTIADSASITVNGGTLDLATNSDTVGAVTLTSGSITGSGTLTGTSYAVSAGTISAKLAGSSVNFSKSTAGTVAIENTDNSFNGTVTLVGGNTTIAKLAIGGSTSSLGSGSSAIILNGATLTYLGSTVGTTDRAIDMRAGVVIQNNSTSGTISYTAANVIQGGTASARTLTLGGSNADDNTFSSILGNSGSGANISTLQKNGLGKWIITGTQTYTGATIINQGTLSVSGSTVLGGVAGSTAADAGNIVFGSNLNSGTLLFETAANLGAADQIRFRNTGGTVGQGGALVYTGTTNQTLSKTLQSDSSIGIRIESNSVGGSLKLNGAFSQTNRSLFLGGTGTGDNTLATGFVGAGGITKRDGGTWILTGTNNYSGATSVTGGILVIGSAGSLANTTTTIGINGTLAGGGSIGGATTIQGTHSPGFSPGTQTFSNGLNYADTATLNWELTDNTTGGRGTNYDAVNVSGGSFGLATGATIDLSFGGTVDFLNSLWDLNQEWLVVDLSGSATAADSNLFTIGSITGGANWSPLLGSFDILRKDGSSTADSVYLTWTPIPEPRAALLGGIGLFFLLRRRRVA